MPGRINQLHVEHLIAELRRCSVEGQQRVAGYEDDGLHIGVASALMNDAAEALGELLAARTANMNTLPVKGQLPNQRS